MALGNLTYKTPNAINKIAQDLSGSEGCGLKLSAQGVVSLATAATDLPYGIVVVGCASVDGTYWASTNSTTQAQGVIAQSSLEVVDALGCVAQVTAGAGAITVGMVVTVGASGAYVSASGISIGEWYWGYALTACAAGEQFVMRFQPFVRFS